MLLDFHIGAKKIACGSTHTVVLAGLIKLSFYVALANFFSKISDDGKIWGCGFAKFGQLGNSYNEKLDRLTLLEAKLPGKIMDIKPNGWSTLIIVENTD